MIHAESRARGRNGRPAEIRYALTPLGEAVLDELPAAPASVTRAGYAPAGATRRIPR